jgi:hypothetical protein
MHDAYCFCLLSMIAAAALLVWSGLCAWRGSNRFLKWGGVGLAAMLVVAVSCVAALTIVGMVRQHARGAPVLDLKVEATRSNRARSSSRDEWRAISINRCARIGAATGASRIVHYVHWRRARHRCGY